MQCHWKKSQKEPCSVQMQEFDNILGFLLHQAACQHWTHAASLSEEALNLKSLYWLTTWNKTKPYALSCKINPVKIKTGVIYQELRWDPHGETPRSENWRSFFHHHRHRRHIWLKPELLLEFQLQNKQKALSLCNSICPVCLNKVSIAWVTPNIPLLWADRSQQSLQPTSTFFILITIYIRAVLQPLSW